VGLAEQNPMSAVRPRDTADLVDQVDTAKGAGSATSCTSKIVWTFAFLFFAQQQASIWQLQRESNSLRHSSRDIDSSIERRVEKLEMAGLKSSKIPEVAAAGGIYSVYSKDNTMNVVCVYLRGRQGQNLCPKMLEYIPSVLQESVPKNKQHSGKEPFFFHPTGTPFCDYRSKKRPNHCNAAEWQQYRDLLKDAAHPGLFCPPNATKITSAHPGKSNGKNHVVTFTKFDWCIV
jgi:hypothetical protein